MYFVKSVKLYIKRKELLDDEPYLFHIGSGLFVASFGYMLSGIVNDSLPVTAPLFWSIVGIGIAVNQMIQKADLVLTTEEQAIDQHKESHANAEPNTVSKKKKQSRKQRKNKK